MTEHDTSYAEQLSQLIAMGYDPETARIALDASGGDVERAVEILLVNESTTGTAATAAGVTSSYEGKIAKDVVNQWSEQLLGDKYHSTAKARAKEVGQTAKSAWSVAVEKIKQVDQQYKLSVGAQQVIQTCDSKLKAFDEKHDWSNKATKSVSEAGVVLNRTLENAKKSLAEQQQQRQQQQRA